MSQLTKIENELQKAPSLKAAMSLEFVQDRFIKNYEAISGKKDGQNKFQQEVFSLLQMANENQAINNCDRFSLFAALVQVGATGLSLRDGKLYLIPYGKTLKVQISAHGKRELLGRMKNVAMVYEAQIVLKGDSFKHDKINNKVVEHVVKDPMANIKLDDIVASYCRIKFKDNSVVDVVVYHDDILKAKSKSRTKDGGPWADFPGQMAKKLAYNRAYTLYHVYPENVVMFAQEVSEGEDGNFTEDNATDAEVVDEDTGEITQITPTEEVKQAAPPREDKKKKDDPEALI